MFWLPLIATAIGAGSSVASGAAANKASKESAAATVRAGSTEQKAANANAALLVKQSNNLKRNAREVVARGKTLANRIRTQAAINGELAKIEYVEQLRTADVFERQAGQALSLGLAKEAEFDREAADAEAAGLRSVVAQAKASREFLGREKQATASAGFVGSGSELDRLVESASRFEAERFDIATATARESRRLRFGGDLARYEGEVAAFEGREQGRTIRFGAEIGKFTASVDAWNSAQEAATVIRDSHQTAANLYDEAADKRAQAQLTRKYGAAAVAGSVATASATRAGGRAAAVGGVASAALTIADYRGRYAASSPRGRV